MSRKTCERLTLNSITNALSEAMDSELTVNVHAVSEVPSTWESSADDVLQRGQR